MTFMERLSGASQNSSGVDFSAHAKPVIRDDPLKPILACWGFVDGASARSCRTILPSVFLQQCCKCVYSLSAYVIFGCLMYNMHMPSLRSFVSKSGKLENWNCCRQAGSRCLPRASVTIAEKLARLRRLWLP